MDIFFQDPSDIPLPPEEVRIRQFSAQPRHDGRRVRVILEITPFQKRPSGEISVRDAQGDEVANLSIIETIDPNMEFTVHLRGPKPAGQYTAAATLFYTAPLPETREGESAPDRVELPEPTIVDRAETSFVIADS